MTMIRRRLMLAIGAALLVGGWGATRYAVEQQRMYSQTERTSGASYRTQLRERSMVRSNWRRLQFPYIGGVVGMAVGAGLIGFAALRRTNHKDE